VKAIRASHHTTASFPYPLHPSGLLYDIQYTPRNNEILTEVLNEECSTKQPFSLYLSHPFRSADTRRKSVSYSVYSDQLMRLQKDLMPRLRDIILVRGEIRRNIPIRHGFLKDLVDIPFRPSVPIRHGLDKKDANQLVRYLNRRYEGKPPSLTAIGLSLGPKPTSIYQLGLEPPPWQHFPFLGAK
jgi:hypothetical protein